jgi:hypothetical protein
LVEKNLPNSTSAVKRREMVERHHPEISVKRQAELLDQPHLHILQRDIGYVVNKKRVLTGFPYTVFYVIIRHKPKFPCHR